MPIPFSALVALGLALTAGPALTAIAEDAAPDASSEERFAWDCSRAEPSACRYGDGVLRLCSPAGGSFVRAIRDAEAEDGTLAFRWNPGATPLAWKQLYVYFRFGEFETQTHHRVVFRVDQSSIAFQYGLTGTTVPFVFQPRWYEVVVTHEIVLGRGVVTAYLDGVPVGVAAYPASHSATRWALEAADDGSCQSIDAWSAPNGGTDAFPWRCEVGTCGLDESLLLCQPNHFARARWLGNVADGTARLTWNPREVANWKQFYVYFRLDEGLAGFHRVILDVQADGIRFDGNLRGTVPVVPFAFEARDYALEVSHAPEDGIGTVRVRMDGVEVATATYPASETATVFAVDAADNGSCHSVRDVAIPR